MICGGISCMGTIMSVLGDIQCIEGIIICVVVCHWSIGGYHVCIERCGSILKKSAGCYIL